jgi:hypothetical protein
MERRMRIMARTFFGRVYTIPLQYAEVRDEGQTNWAEQPLLSFRLHTNLPFEELWRADYTTDVLEGETPKCYAGCRVRITIDPEPVYGIVYEQELHFAISEDGMPILRSGRRWMALRFPNALLSFLPRFLGNNQ